MRSSKLVAVLSKPQTNKVRSCVIIKEIEDGGVLERVIRTSDDDMSVFKSHLKFCPHTYVCISVQLQVIGMYAI